MDKDWIFVMTELKEASVNSGHLLDFVSGWNGYEIKFAWHSAMIYLQGASVTADNVYWEFDTSSFDFVRYLTKGFGEDKLRISREGTFLDFRVSEIDLRKGNSYAIPYEAT